MSIEDSAEKEPRVEPQDPETVQDILANAPEAAQANMERAEAILGELEDEQVPEKYADQADWGFTFTGTLAHHPEIFKTWWAEEGHVFGSGNLNRGFKELLAAAIAYNRGAEICIAWHTTSAAIENVEPERFAIAADFDNQKEQLSEKEWKAIEFGVKSVEAPTTVTDADIQELRDLGYSDADIVELTTTAGTAAKFANFALTLDI